jgi:exonuclease SbcC
MEWVKTQLDNRTFTDEDFNLLVRDVDSRLPIDRFSGGEQDDIAVALRIALSRYLAELHNVHESTFLIFFRDLRQPGRGAPGKPPHCAPNAGVPFPSGILLISPIAEIQGGLRIR